MKIINTNHIVEINIVEKDLYVEIVMNVPGCSSIYKFKNLELFRSFLMGLQSHLVYTHIIIIIKDDGSSRIRNI